MDWFTVIALVAFGVSLIYVEVIFVPGTTFVGLIGLLLAAAGIWTAYSTLGTNNGHLILAITILVSAVFIFYSFRRQSWNRFALKDTIDGHVNARPELLLEGQTGIAVSALRPSGTANFGEGHYEVHTRGEYVSAGTPIRIVRIVNHKVTVEKIQS
jgi:membrane-bound ClpP family serine protease